MATQLDVSMQWWVTTDAVLTGAWQLPKEKRIVLLFVNVSDESVPAQIQFKAAANGIRVNVLRAQRTTTDGSKTDWQTWPTPFDRSVAFPPRQAEAWELRW